MILQVTFDMGIEATKFHNRKKLFYWCCNVKQNSSVSLTQTVNYYLTHYLLSWHKKSPISVKMNQNVQGTLKISWIKYYNKYTKLCRDKETSCGSTKSKLFECFKLDLRCLYENNSLTNLEHKFMYFAPIKMFFNTSTPLLSWSDALELCNSINSSLTVLENLEQLRHVLHFLHLLSGVQTTEAVFLGMKLFTNQV